VPDIQKEPIKGLKELKGLKGLKELKKKINFLWNGSQEMSL
jgi:hypothetical protein